MRRPPLAVPVGCPAGVGPSVAATAAVRCASGDRLVLFGDAARLEPLVRRAGGRLRSLDASGSLELEEGEVGVAHVVETADETVAMHAPSEAGGRAQLAFLDAAIDAALDGRARGVATGPTSKEAIALTGHEFTGQTEHLAARSGRARDSVTMMFLGPRLRVALVTTHLSIREAPLAITAPRVERSVLHLAEALAHLKGEAGPVEIQVTGLNPHAGEGGLFGDEEQATIAPALTRLRLAPPFADGRARLIGPRPAEAVFREAAAGRFDGVVAMVHDQATIASKLLDWGSAVNVTWGLPFVRASVDHGVAYDAAKAGAASDEGMMAALKMAQRLTVRA